MKFPFKIVCLSVIAILIVTEGCKQNSASGPEPEILLPHDDFASWSPDGRMIALVSSHLGNENIFVLEIGDHPSNIVIDDLSELTSYSGMDRGVSWSPDGSQITFTSDRDGNFEIYVVDVISKKVERLTHNKASDYDAVWSPDGQKIAFVSNRDGSLEIYSMNPDGTEQTQLTKSNSRNCCPVWSPDGQKIAFTSRDNGNLDVFTIHFDGSNLQQISDSIQADFAPVWSLDGSEIYFLSDSQSKFNYEYDIHRIDISTGEAINLTNNEEVDYWYEYWQIWSPKGDRFVYVSEKDGNQDIFVMDVEEKQSSRLTNTTGIDEYHPFWSPDGKHIAYLSHGEGDRHWELNIMDENGSNQTSVLKVPWSLVDIENDLIG